ncbi:MAG: hypothetical protein AUH75_02930 [Gemmatimonadetes bacterium 13_1_40CM_4_65_7]|nr:MAG: hypothetical protein AUH75_02930 [Gemmatimonadetes bacterium 13_1_40CM_4_65_7]
MPRLPGSTIDRPQQLVRRDRDVEIARDENGPPDFPDRLVTIAIDDFARQRHRLAADEQAHGRSHRRRFEGQATNRSGHRRPIVQTTAIRERPPQEIGLRPVRVPRHREDKAAGDDSARRPGRHPGFEPFQRPPRGRADVDAIDAHRAVARVPDTDLDLQALALRHDAIIRRAIDADPGGNRERPLEYAPLLRVRRAEYAQRAHEIRQRRGRPPWRQHSTRGVDQRRVTGHADRRIHTGEHRRLIRRGHARLGRDQRDARGGGSGALQLTHVLRAMPAATRHRDLEV